MPFFGFFLLATALAQRRYDSDSRAVIYGVVIDQDRKPAKGVRLTAWPEGPISASLPHKRTNDSGEYRFENLQWGKYHILAEDDDAGYSIFSTGEGHNEPPEVRLSPEQPVAEMKVCLPPKAGFIYVHLTNRRTGDAVPTMNIVVDAEESPDHNLFSMNSYSNHVVLIPPERNLLLHVTSDGYREWDESAGKGKPIHLASGAQMTLEIKLDPLD